MKSKYPFVVRPVNYDEMGVNFIIEYLDFPGITGGGDTVDEALEMGQEGLDMYIEVLQADGKTIPQPTDMNVSGRITLRIPKSLHIKAIGIANNEGISLNSLITDSLSQRVYTTNIADRVYKLLIADKIEQAQRQSLWYDSATHKKPFGSIKQNKIEDNLSYENKSINFRVRGGNYAFTV